MKNGGFAQQFLEKITDLLDTDYVEQKSGLTGLRIFVADFSPLRLRLSTKSLIIPVTEDEIQRQEGSEINRLIQQELYERQEAPGSAIVLFEGNTDFLSSIRKAPFWAATFDANTIQRIVDHANPIAVFTSELAARIPLRFLSPYDYNRPATGSLFYGRSSELGLILQHPNRSYAVEGGRRIGKTSLLRMAEKILKDRILPDEQHKRIVWFDFWGYGGEEPFFEEVVRHFGEGFPKLVRPDFASYFPRFIARMKAAHGGPIIFIFDEIDDLIAYEKETNRQLLGLLKKIADAQDARIIMAGFRDLSAELNYHGTPLQFCHPIRLQNLKSEDAKSMLRGPMSSLGIKLQRGVIPQILNNTGGHPQLIQHFGQSLISLLDSTGDRIINSGHVQKIKQVGEFYDSLVGPLIDNTNDLELAVVHSLSEYNEFGIEEIDGILVDHGMNLSAKDVVHICRTLEKIGMIVRRGKAERFQFSIPLLPELARDLADEEFVWRKAKSYWNSLVHVNTVS